MMENLKYISDLQHYTETLKGIRQNQAVYYIRNDRNTYAIAEMKDWDKLKARIKLLIALKEGERSAREKDWLTADEVEIALGLGKRN